MSKTDPVVKKETINIAVGTLICAVVMNLIFFAVSRFTDKVVYDYTVITGTALGCFAAVLNFYLMGRAVQRSVNTEDAGAAKKRFQLNYTARTFLLVAIAAVGVILPYFHWFSTLVSVLFPRVVIFFRTFKNNLDNAKNPKQ